MRVELSLAMTVQQAYQFAGASRPNLRGSPQSTTETKSSLPSGRATDGDGDGKRSSGLTEDVSSTPARRWQLDCDERHLCPAETGHEATFIQAVKWTFVRLLRLSERPVDHNDAGRVDEPFWMQSTRSGATAYTLPAPHRNAWFIDV